jgi:hypothetical protein
MLRNRHALCSISHAVRASARRSIPQDHPACTKPIEKVAEGDWVWARDERTGRREPRRVKALYKRTCQPVAHVEVCQSSRRHAKTQRITATQEHPFWVRGKGWVAACRLQPGDELQPKDKARTVCVVSVSSAPRRQEVFNFEVDGLHNYYVGDVGVLVHNASREPNLQREENKLGKPALATGHRQREQTYYMPFAARPLEQVLEAGRSGRRLLPWGVRPGLEDRTAAEFWMMGQMTVQEFHAMQDYANSAGHAFGIAGSFAETLEGTAHRSAAIVYPHVDERMVGWRRRPTLFELDDVDLFFWLKKLAPDPVEQLVQHVGRTLRRKKVDPAYAGYHMDLYDAPPMRGEPRGAGMLIFQPANDIQILNGDRKPHVDAATQRVDSVRVIAPWQDASWFWLAFTRQLPVLPGVHLYGQGVEPYPSR